MPAYKDVKSPAAEQMERYIAAAINPFDAPVGCMPKSPGIHSSKHKVWAKATMVANDQGFCYAIGRTSFVNNQGATNSDFYPLTYSTLPYGQTVTNQDSTVQGVSGVEVNSLFVNTDFGSLSLHGRIISRGLRIRYIGTELNRGGRILAFSHPQGESLNGLSFDDVLQYPTAKTVPVSRSWQSICYHPVDETETDYATSHTGPRNAPNMACMVSGTSSGNSFEVEYYIHFEVIGPTLGTAVSTSIADDSTFSKVQATLLHLDTTYYDKATHFVGQTLRTASEKLLLQALKSHSADMTSYVLAQLTGANMPRLTYP